MRVKNQSLIGAGLGLVALMASCASAPATLGKEAREALVIYPSDGPFENSSFTSIDGVELHYLRGRARGLARGRALLVHGLGGSVFSWRYLAPALNDAGYETLAVDLPPFGWSCREDPGGQSLRDRAALYWKLLDALSYRDGSWILVGHSLGGRLATLMAEAKPDRVKALVLLDAEIFSEVNAWFLRLPFVGGIVEGQLASRLADFDEMGRLLGTAYARKASREETMGYFAPLQIPGTAAAVMRFFTLAGDGGMPALSRLAMPALVVWGDKDSWVRPDRGDRLVRELPDASLVTIRGAGHCPMETHPSETEKAVLDFLAGLE